ncbi:MAG: threonyl-tRNA synthetase, partial [Parcubacteria group bacterium Greene1014_20]
MNDLFSMRHTLAHIMMQALRRIWPDAQPGVGPAIENGWYHDFSCSHKITEADFQKIEEEMRKIIKENLEMKKEMLAVDAGIEKLKSLKYQYTAELAQDLKNSGEKEISFYAQGEFINMCKGPHIEATGKAGAFVLSKVAGSYWKGDASKDVMQRIYGYAFATQKELDEYLAMMEEAKKRDHRKLGVELDLFTFSDLVGAGLPLWTPKGTIMRGLLDDYVWSLRKKAGYQKVEIPHITRRDLYDCSGHWEKYKDDLFKIQSRDERQYALKPMNCPHHTQIYKHLPRSYRELPQRYSNTTMVYRDEQSGELSGLSRVLAITQDDAHVFCRKDQVKDEMRRIWGIVDAFYGTFGFSKLRVRLSLHDPKAKEKYLGSPEIWAQAESELRDLAKEKKADYFEAPGEAAFYGPKVDFMAKDSIGREWQLATMQLDMNMPERFDLSCMSEEGKSERIVMIHCAIMGSIERFLSVIIEHFAGVFPVWICPVQVKILTIGESVAEYAKDLADKLDVSGIRCECDYASDMIGKKIKKSLDEKVPYMLVVGEKEK